MRGMKTLIRSYLIWSMLIGGVLGYAMFHTRFEPRACYLVGLAIGLLLGETLVNRLQAGVQNAGEHANVSVRS